MYWLVLGFIAFMLWWKLTHMKRCGTYDYQIMRTCTYVGQQQHEHVWTNDEWMEQYERR